MDTNVAESPLQEPRDFSSPWHFSDVVLAVEDTKFHVHKCILSMWSPVFETMFTSQFLESTAKEIPLPGKRADEIEELLKLIYSSGTKLEVTEENHEFLLELAQEYQMDKVKEFCVEYLASNITEQNCLQRHKVAERFELESILNKSIKEASFISSNEIENSEEFSDLKLESRFNICMARVKELEKTVETYIKTCSKLIEYYYKEVFTKVAKNQHCDYSNSHKQRFSTFEVSCNFCMAKVRDATGEIGNINLYGSFKTLHSLGCSRVVKQVLSKRY